MLESWPICTLEGFIDNYNKLWQRSTHACRHVHQVFSDMEHPHRCWPHDWTRDQCVTVAQLCTGHSPLLVAYLHRIGRRDSATCPHCNGADETAEHLVLHCPAHDQARRESWPNLHYQSDPRRLWNFLERIVGRWPVPWPGMRERERAMRDGHMTCCATRDKARLFSPPVHRYIAIAVVVFINRFIVIHQGSPTLHNRTSLTLNQQPHTPV